MSLLKSAGERAVMDDELYIDPYAEFGEERVRPSTEVHCIILRGDRQAPHIVLKKLPEASALAGYWEQYVAGLRRYDLEEKIFEDYCQSNFDTFAEIIAGQRSRLLDLINTVPVFRLDGDLLSMKAQERLAALVQQELGAL